MAGMDMSIKITMAALGLMAGLALGINAAISNTGVNEQSLSEQDKLDIVHSQTFDVLKGSAGVILQALACDDRKLAAKAQELADAALRARGAASPESIIAKVEANFARLPELKPMLAKDCPASLKKAQAEFRQLTAR